MQGFDRGPDFRITRVWAKNFRSVADVSLEMDALTVLVGPNASGKSNLLDILRFIKDALRDLEVAVSRRQGMDGVARHGAGDKGSDLLEIEMGVATMVRMWANSKHGYYSVEYGFTLACMGNGGYRVSSEYGNVREGDEPAVAEFRIEDGNLTASDFSVEGLRQHSILYDDIDFDTNDLTLPILIRMFRQLTAQHVEISAAKDITVRTVCASCIGIWWGCVSIASFRTQFGSRGGRRTPSSWRRPLKTWRPLSRE